MCIRLGKELIIDTAMASLKKEMIRMSKDLIEIDSREHDEIVDLMHVTLGSVAMAAHALVGESGPEELTEQEAAFIGRTFLTTYKAFRKEVVEVSARYEKMKDPTKQAKQGG